MSYDISNIGIRFEKELNRNGWMNDLSYGSSNDETFYKMRICVDHYCVCTAMVSDNANGLDIYGDLGVLLVETQIEIGTPYTWSDLEEMAQAIQNAEKNLLAVGIPFEANYQFHGEDVGAKTTRNMQLRKEWGLESLVWGEGMNENESGS